MKFGTMKTRVCLGYKLAVSVEGGFVLRIQSEMSQEPTPATSQPQQYVVGLSCKQTSNPFPVCLVFDGALQACTESTLAGETQTLELIYPSLNAETQNQAIQDIIVSDNMSVFSTISKTSVMMLQSVTGPTMFRLVQNLTSVVTRNPVQVVAEKCFLASINQPAKLDIDLDGQLAIMFDLNQVYVFLFKGIMYVDGGQSWLTTVEKVEEMAKKFEAKRELLLRDVLKEPSVKIEKLSSRNSIESLWSPKENFTLNQSYSTTIRKELNRRFFVSMDSSVAQIKQLQATSASFLEASEERSSSHSYSQNKGLPKAGLELLKYARRLFPEPAFKSPVAEKTQSRLFLTALATVENRDKPEQSISDRLLPALNRPDSVENSAKTAKQIKTTLVKKKVKRVSIQSTGTKSPIKLALKSTINTDKEKNIKRKVKVPLAANKLTKTVKQVTFS